MPPVPKNQMDATVALVRRVGGPAAASALTTAILGGYPESMQTWVGAAATASVPTKASTRNKKRQREAMPSIEMRQNVWVKFGEDLPELRDIMSRDATSCATERH